MKRYWKKETGLKWPEQCRIRGCTRLANGGGHVHIRESSIDRDDVYIIPMCNPCNKPQNTSWMTTNAGTKAAKVEEEDTSGDEETCY